MERRRRDLEAEPGDDESDPDVDDGRLGGDEVPEIGPDLQDLELTGPGIHEGDAVDEDRRGKRAEKEVLDGGFVRLGPLPGEPGEDIEGDGAHLEAEEQHDQVVGGHHQ